MSAPPRLNPDRIPPRRYASAEVRARFGISESTLRRWRLAGVLGPVVSDGYRNLYDAAKVDALRAAGTMPRRTR